MESLHHRVETWIRDQRSRILRVTWPNQWRIAVPWPWINGREHRKRVQAEYDRRKKQLYRLCSALKAESMSDLQDVLCCMVLSECVYKRPAAEMLKAVNRYKSDFGGQIVSLERVQPSSDHVPHSYLLAEAGETLYASFIGTKQYKDVMADANIFQGAIFHEEGIEEDYGVETTESDQFDSEKVSLDKLPKLLEAKPKQPKPTLKPAVHRGFMARAKGIPALELYKLAQKKNRKLVLCGHSLGGAVAALATLAILRVIAASSSVKSNEKVQVKCITFSQPPVGNAALRDYVNRKGWQHYFKSYCIPEDLVPRILSPAYFHHYNTQLQSSSVETSSNSSLIPNYNEGAKKQKIEKVKENEEEQLVLGLGPVQTSFWRLFRLVPLEGVRRQISKYTGKKVDPVETASAADPVPASSFDIVEAAPQSLEIQEGSDGISLKPLSKAGKGSVSEARDGKSSGKSDVNSKDNYGAWRRVPSLPSYVPFGQLYLLGSSSVESLSGAEYSKLTSVQSVLAEMKERFQSHSMKSYRSRFQRIYDECMADDASLLVGVDQLQQFSHLHKWLGLSIAGAVELGHIVDSPVIHTATSIVPLGWSGTSVQKNEDPLKVDITGLRLHLCTLVQARVNGKWCSTTVEAFPSSPTYSTDDGAQPDLQKIRVVIGPPLRRPPKHQMVADPLLPLFSSIHSNSVDNKVDQNVSSFLDGFIRPEGLSDFVVFCTSDFATVFKEVHIRTRRVRLVGLEGAGKSSLLKAILDQDRRSSSTKIESFHIDIDVQEVIAGGLCYLDSASVNLQDLHLEASRFRDELWNGIRDLSKKTDLIVLVHNLSHRIPRYNNPSSSQQEPALSLLLDEAKSLGIPWVLAITNKFSVSAHQQKAAVNDVLQAYQASPNTTEVVNSCPYVMPSAGDASLSWDSGDANAFERTGPKKLFFAPLDLVRKPFQKKAVVLPVEGVAAMCQLVNRMLRTHEEVAIEELARDRLMLELAREHDLAAIREAATKENSMSAAAVGASLGAGLGLVLAIVMGAASALRKP